MDVKSSGIGTCVTKRMELVGPAKAEQTRASKIRKARAIIGWENGANIGPKAENLPMKGKIGAE